MNIKKPFCGICKLGCDEKVTFYTRPVHKNCLDTVTQSKALELCFGLKKI